MRIKFDQVSWAVEQNNCLTKIVNICFVYELYDCLKIPLKYFTLKKCLFGAINIVKKSDKVKLVYRRYGITFDERDWQSFGNGNARNVIIFGVDNSSSSHDDNLKNNFLIVGLGPTFKINGNFGSPEKTYSINVTKASLKFCLSLHYNDGNCYLFVNGKEIIKYKADNKNVNFPTRFCLGSMSDGFSAAESREVSLNGNLYDFSVDYNSIDKSDILNIHKYLMTKNNIK